MNVPSILIVEDEPEVRYAIERDLAPFADHFRIESAEDVGDARDVLDHCLQDGDPFALILCDHLLPGTNGVDFLVSLNMRGQDHARKILITGQAGLQDTIKAINEAGLNYYIAKPWDADELVKVVRKQLTDFVLENVEDVTPFVDVLEGDRLMKRSAPEAD